MDSPQSIDPSEHSETSEQPVTYFTDLRRVKAAREDPARFEALSEDYRALVRGTAGNYFLRGGSYDDLVQEAMLGFYKAVRDYNGRGSGFASFAELCVKRQVITAVKTDTRRKHEPLNRAVSYSGPAPGHEDSAATLLEVLPAESRLPEDIVIGKEGMQSLVGFMMTELSDIEYRSMLLQMEGKDYQTIADELGSDFKVVDNALQRAKRKIRAYLEETET